MKVPLADAKYGQSQIKIRTLCADAQPFTTLQELKASEYTGESAVLLHTFGFRSVLSCFTWNELMCLTTSCLHVLRIFSNQHLHGVYMRFARALTDPNLDNSY